MSNGLESLHKVLKDQTRRNVICLLHEKGNLSYTDLMTDLEVGSTGLLNYHLKVLGDLIRKDESGLYILSEKGGLAWRLLTEFPDDFNALRKKWHKRLFTLLIISQVVYLTIIITLYLFGIVTFDRLILGISYFVMATIVVYFGYRMQRHIPLSGSKEEKNRMKIGYTVGGVWLGLVVFFFGVGFLIRIIQEIIRQPVLHTIFWTDWYLGFSLILAPAIGGVFGYYFGKKRGFQKPKWAIWLDNRL